MPAAAGEAAGAAGAEAVGHGQVAPGVERAWVAVAGHTWAGPDPVVGLDLVAGLDLVVRSPVLERARVAPPGPVPRDLQHAPRPVRAPAQAPSGRGLVRVVVLVQAAAWVADRGWAVALVAGPAWAVAWAAGPDWEVAWAAGPELAAEITSRSGTATAGTAAGTTVTGALAPGVLGQVGAWGLVPAT